jgi:hypothetical protein
LVVDRVREGSDGGPATEEDAAACDGLLASDTATTLVTKTT